MGASVSHAAAATPHTPLPPPPAASPPPAAGIPPPPDAPGKAAEPEKWDYLNLPCPVKYEEIQREVMMSLKPELFEGLRFDFHKPLSPVFSLSHSILLGNMEVPSQSAHVLKIPNGTYEFGANVLDPKRVLIARILTDGRLTARVSSQLTENLAFKVQAQLTHEPHYSQGMFSFDYKGSDYQTQFQFGNNAFFGVNYIQSVTPHLSLGGEAFWLGRQRRSGMGIAARYNTDKVIATAQLASTGMLSVTYVHKVSEKVALAADFLHNASAGESTASAGYDYMLRQCRLRGRIDTNGVVAAFLEERINAGVNFLLSAEVDHWKKDYKFGFGMTVGE